MHDGKYILFFIGALGAFNGILLAIYFMFLAKRRNLSSFFLGCLMAALSLRIGKAVLIYFDSNLPEIYRQIGISACLLIGPALFFFLKSSIDQLTQVPRSWKYQIGALLAAIVFMGVMYRYATYPELWRKYSIQVVYAVWTLYIIAAGVVIRGLFARIRSTSDALKPAENWLLAIYSVNVAIFLSFMMAYLIRDICETYYGGAIIFSLVLYAMIFIHLYHSRTAEQFYVVPAKNPVRKVDEATVMNLVTTLEQQMVKGGLFKNPNLTLSELAKSINIPAHQLSQLLNDNLGKNFTSYVNEYRIEEACRMIAQGHPFSLEAIGYEVGFNSKSTFYTAFKKIKATTPLMYKEDLAKRSDASLVR
ncbi:helix-turn-helix domain-containing protein [Xanthocytophaga agilis]|uniref:Helix-turn-helix domain-containing protein n=1 Tax=Xanthocytophaga agilis TaxID=3048010 RepID=A0AAE3RE51_9BACT|nr:helix-turn-helix domain-containing protein [Xanthocytophaga agilis]MDJ1506512.1 helix-turn-helix domain-containing protein [Xanthocytophaga agilis]